MRLEKLYSGKSFLLEARAAIPPGRLPDPAEHENAMGFKAAVDFDQAIEDADRKFAEGNCEEAYRELKTELIKNYISGLRWSLKQEDPNSRYFYVVGDIDNMKWLNDESGLSHVGVNSILQRVGTLMYNHIEGQYDVEDMQVYKQGDPLAGKVLRSGIEQTKTFHPHGDEFGARTNITSMDTAQKGQTLLGLIESCLKTSDQLAKIAWYASQDATQRQTGGVQATVSFAISDNKRRADLILTKTKAQTKYSVTVDSRLIQQYINPFKELRRELDQLTGVGVETMRGSKTAKFVRGGIKEAHNKQLQAVMNQPGCLLLELDPLQIPRHEKLELLSGLEEKLHYLRNPNGVLCVPCGDKNMYYPLKEPYNGTQVL